MGAVLYGAVEGLAVAPRSAADFIGFADDRRRLTMLIPCLRRMAQIRIVAVLRSVRAIYCAHSRFGAGDLDYPELGYGLAIEEHYDLSSLHPIAQCVAELGRICVLENHRGSGAARALYAGLSRISVELGVQRWVGCANSEAQTLEQLARVMTTIGQRTLWSDLRFELLSRAAPQWRCSTPDGASDQRLPPVLRSYVRWGELRFCGEAIFDDRFARFAVPFVGDPRRALALTRD